MILDWNTHCYKIHTTRKLRRDDPSDNKSVVSQEAHYLKYLARKKRSYPEIYLFWTKIKNGTASVFKDDPEQQVATFAKIFRASTNIPDKAFEQHYGPVKIYESEIRFLNSVQAPVWVKQYWLIMLIYWKFAAQHTKNVEINGTLCNWAIRQTDIANKRYGRHQDEIAKYNCSVEGHVMQSDIYKRKNSRKYWFDWALEKSDEVFVEIKNLDNVKKALKMLDGNTLVCPNCGKKFIASSKQHTDLCPKCYKSQRKKDVCNNVRKHREVKKSDKIEKK